MRKEKVGIIGLLISSFGALVSALSFAENSGGYVKSSFSGIQYHIAIVSSYGFKIGLFLMILGFLFQILEKVYKENLEISSSTLIAVVLMAMSLFVILIILSNHLLFP